ncbi:RimK/LysX family protein [Marivita sp.]|uniref:ATP-dependent zinc protease family protein n=1 Tax=Marivita sp. TaxID=2003365 RepID=UPI00321937BD
MTKQDTTAPKATSRSKKSKPRIPVLIGWRERIELPDLGLGAVEAKIDTGARTTALHASRIRTFEKDGALWVEFHPEHDRLDSARMCQCPIKERRAITNTSGVPEERIIIRTRMWIAGHRLSVDISLADRAEMAFPIIIGRTALRRGRLLVDSSRSWLTTPQEGR